MQPGGGAPYPPPAYPWGAYVPGWPAVPPPMPRPKGVPTRTPFLVGAVGHFFAAGMAIPAAIFSIGFGRLFGFGSGLGWVFLVVGAIAGAAFVVHLVGFYGLWRNYGSQLALGTLVYGLIAVGYNLASTAVIVFIVNPFSFGLLLSILIFVGPVLLGVLYIVEGSAYIVVRHYLIPGPAIASGVLFIIAGGFVCSLVFEIVGGILTVPALIIGGILLTRAPLPYLYGPPGVAAPEAPLPSDPPRAP